MNYGNKTVKVACIEIHSTENAIYIEQGPRKVWIPLSQVDRIDRDRYLNYKIILHAKKWIVVKNGLQYTYSKSENLNNSTDDEDDDDNEFEYVDVHED